MNLDESPVIPPVIQSQYSNSSGLLPLLYGFEELADPLPFLREFYDKVYNLKTAVGACLDVWGRIIGIGRVIEVQYNKPFGFTGSLLAPWNQGQFSNGEKPTSVVLLDEPYRKLLFFKAYANIASSTLADINKFLALVFADRPFGSAWAVDTGIMTMDYRFSFSLTPYERFLLSDSGVAPKPGAVQVTIVENA
jgi:hypothetical protein